MDLFKVLEDVSPYMLISVVVFVNWIFVLRFSKLIEPIYVFIPQPGVKVQITQNNYLVLKQS